MSVKFSDKVKTISWCRCPKCGRYDVLIYVNVHGNVWAACAECDYEENIGTVFQKGIADKIFTTLQPFHSKSTIQNKISQTRYLFTHKTKILRDKIIDGALEERI